MVSFQIKKLVSPTLVGEILKKERENKKLTLEEAAQALELSVKYLKLLELSAWNKLPGQIYVKSFVKKYAGWLGLPTEQLLNKFLADQKNYGQTAAKKNPPQIILELKHLGQVPALFRRLVSGALAVLLAIYLSYEVAGIFSSPLLIVESPIEGYINGSPMVLVKGQTEPEVKIQINGKEVVSESDGAFVADIELGEGLNVIKVSATKRHGGTSTILRNVVVQPSTATN